MPSWLPVALTIADFVTQRVDRIGPVSFEPPEKQPPERSQDVGPRSVDAPPESSVTPTARSSPQETGDAPEMGFRARGGGGGSEPEDDENEVRCTFRSMRVSDPPTTYEV